MQFHEKLIGLRRAKGLSQEQLASQIDVSRQAVSKWETAESQPDLAKLMLLSDVFAVTLDELCGREAQSPPVPPAPAPRPGRRAAWLCAAALVLGLALGLAVGFSTAGIFFPQASPQQQIDGITITGLNLTMVPDEHALRVIFSPGVAKDTFAYKVLLTGPGGETTGYPAVYNQGVCTSDVPYDPAYSLVYGGYTLRAVIRDGDNEYTSGLATLLTIDETGLCYELLWNK